MKIGLVLSGGGALGAYQIGVWKALRELNIEKSIKVISGTSIGALNALLMTQGNLEIAEDIWNELSIEKVLPTDNFDLLKKGIMLTVGSKNLSFVKKYIPKTLEQGNISREGLLDIVERHLDFDKIKNSKIACYATCTSVEKFSVKYFKYNEYSKDSIKQILLATSAIPTIYETEEIEGEKYLDGGMVDNIPIQPVYGEGCDLIIVSYLSNEDYINRNNYPNVDIIELKPRWSCLGVREGMLDFDNRSISKRMNAGYEETINFIKPIMNMTNIINKNSKKSYIDEMRSILKRK